MPMKSTKLICRKMSWELVFFRPDASSHSIFYIYVQVMLMLLYFIKLKLDRHSPLSKPALVPLSPTRWQHCHSCPNTWEHRWEHLQHTVHTLIIMGILLITYPISSKCSLSTAQMVTHTVGVPVQTTCEH